MKAILNIIIIIDYACKQHEVLPQIERLSKYDYRHHQGRRPRETDTARALPLIVKQPIDIVGASSTSDGRVGHAGEQPCTLRLVAARA